MKGEDILRTSIIQLERNFNVKYEEADAERIYPTVGGSQGLQFVFSLFKNGSDIMTSMPCWGTILNMMAHSGVNGIPAELFKDGNFIEENARKALTGKTQAVYINFPTNPNGVVPKEKAVKEFAGWAVSNNLQIISDAPYKYLIYDFEKTPYVSAMNLGSDVNRKTTEISSFSKIIKPDIRLGFARISPEIIENKKAKQLMYYFRNLGAGTPRSAQIGVCEVIKKDPKLSFLKPLVEGYKKKAVLMAECLQQLGCETPEKPDGGYFLFPKTPDNMDGEEFVKKMASENKIGFIPGSSFGGNLRGFEHLKHYFRAGFGGGWNEEKIKKTFQTPDR